MLQHLGVAFEPLPGCAFWLLLVLEDRAHDLALHLETEFEVAQQLADVLALLAIAFPGVGVDYRAAEVGTEAVVAAS